MRRSSNSPISRLGVLLAIVVVASASGASVAATRINRTALRLAPVIMTGEQYCINGTYNCTDAAGPGQPICYTGTVTNCGTATLYNVTVETESNGFVLGPITLDPGQSANYSGCYTPASTPSTNDIVFRGWDNPAGSGDPIAAKQLFGTCSETPPTDEICRTPGFWGTHAGVEKPRSQNITQAVITAAGGSLSICGGVNVTNTLLAQPASALEALCVSPQGEQRLQLARQLTAAALNCVMTNGDASCAGVSVKETFDACNAACAANDGDLQSCINTIDCYNNGGRVLESGLCQIGTCGGDGITACGKDTDCGKTLTGAQIACVALPGNCHDRLLVNDSLGLDFDPPGPAGSSNACNSAISNVCTIFSCN